MSTVTLTTAGFPSARAAARPAARPRLRITRRGRAVLGALLGAPIAAALTLSALSGTPAQAGSTASTTTFEYISVASGESLWDLAAWVAPESDPREVVAALVELNQLPTTEVQPGQRLAIPAEYSAE
ncbi:LysM peptidoglycan-binding domain-containing protein [Protaetiibacter sp. SSC-01]|uniref:LysM peptidoglycan-binding domain-containing protein n=1 Tax=Protaetiibacter sp. SSC-01 TaxID=2759943 RepID=UPI001656B751|nr:LysM peptidoglycan-binding domain-containing protein [Protaetiibacter sp. SSC-01]QNO36593.1 LysM peptidoglycan-binding domain-containing protein [Protaetiibacter sp. SSC-01]